jgi:DNA-binding PadR family transcriptional regulator
MMRKKVFEIDLLAVLGPEWKSAAQIAAEIEAMWEVRGEKKTLFGKKLSVSMGRLYPTLDALKSLGWAQSSYAVRPSQALIAVGALRHQTWRLSALGLKVRIEILS